MPPNVDRASIECQTESHGLSQMYFGGKTGLKAAQTSAEHYKKQVMRAVFALPVEATRPKALHPVPVCESE